MDSKISNLTSYSPALDADVLPIVDTANTLTKKITWANIKVTLKAYFDTLYALVSGNVVTIGTATLTLGASKTPTISNTLTLAGTDGKTLTLTNGLTVTTNDGTLAFGSASKTLTVGDSTTLSSGSITFGSGAIISVPTVTDTVAVLGTAQTYTATQTEKQVVWTNNAIAASSNAATVPITSRLNTVTNSSAATLTITMTTTSAVDGQLSFVRILDFSGVAQTIAWVNTEDSTVLAPTTSNGSTTLFLTVGFVYNGGSGKWRCIAKS